MSDAGQGGDFADMRHPHFEHGHVVLRLQFEQLQGHAKFVVEVPLGAKHRETRREDFRDRFLGRGFAGAACHSDDVLIPMPAHRGGQCLQRDQRIVHNQQSVGMGQLEEIRYFAASHNRGASAPLQRSRDEGVRIVSLPADSKKEIAGRKGAGVDGVSRGRLLRSIAFACPEVSPDPISNVLQLQLHSLLSRACNTCRAMATSSNGITRSPMVCVFS